MPDDAQRERANGHEAVEKACLTFWRALQLLLIATAEADESTYEGRAHVAALRELASNDATAVTLQAWIEEWTAEQVIAAIRERRALLSEDSTS
jgi:hypothetical protein